MMIKAISIIFFNGLGIVLAFLNVVPSALIILTLAIINYYIYHSLLEQRIHAYENELSDLESSSKVQERYSQVQASQLETIIQNLPFPIALLDIEGKFSITNSHFNQFYPSKPLVYSQKSINDEIQSFVRFAYLKEEAYHQNMRLDALDVQAINVPIYDNKRYNGCLLMFLDITSLLEGERVQKRFIADASHELKTPLTSILGMVEILNREHFDDVETRKEFLKHIQDEAQRMDIIIKDLTELSKQANAKMALNTQVVLVDEQIQGAIQSLYPSILKNENQINIECPKHLKIKVDPDKFHQILTNLISNASKYTFKGEINIKVSEDHQHTFIEIKDSGIGISATDLGHIFDRFFRSDSSRSRMSGGSGLGLAIVKAYVNMHQAEINVESELNEGTIVSLKFPK